MSATAAPLRAPDAPPHEIETLALVLGDQLDAESAALRDLRPGRDGVLMLEVREEAEHVPSHRQRTALFLSAMRHFGLSLQESDLSLRYVRLDDPANRQRFPDEILRAAETWRPRRIVLLRPGEHRVTRAIEALAERRLGPLGIPLEMREDEHFLVSRARFRAWATDGRKRLVMEHFYRAQRRRLGVLMDPDGAPRGGSWNYDAENRAPFREAPEPPPPLRFAPDEVTREVLSLVDRAFPDAPGTTAGFGWPVTAAQAEAALADFVAHRLAGFGRHQDAMWAGETFLWHSLLSPALNLKLLRPAACIAAAEAALAAGEAPLPAVEGFVRQILGWREFVRGVYELEGPGYGLRNELDHRGGLPAAFWTGESELACLAGALGGVLRHAYGHHIERLMVIGNAALLGGVDPAAVSAWFLGMYADGVDWATAPNVVGMSQHADGGIVGTKPYAAGGSYVRRMSNYCASCRFDPRARTGASACPLSTLYWDFLDRHQDRFASNPRMGLALRTLERFSEEERAAIRERGREAKRILGVEPAAEPDGR